MTNNTTTNQPTVFIQVMLQQNASLRCTSFVRTFASVETLVYFVNRLYRCIWINYYYHKDYGLHFLRYKIGYAHIIGFLHASITI